MNKLQFSKRSQSRFNYAGVACLMLSLGAACTSSDGVDATDGGESGDGGATNEGGGSVDASHSGDGSSVADAGGHADGGASTEGGQVTPGGAVDLRTASNFAILAMSGIATVPTSNITGDIGISPMAATGLTGFSPTIDSSGVFATSSQVIGKVYAADYTPPSPSNLTTAISDMQLAFTDAAGRAPGVTELGAGNIGGMTLSAGVYAWSTGLDIPTNVTLSGSGTDVWIFQIAQDLTLSSATQVVLAGGATAKNVYWQVSGAATLGTTSQLEGTILSQTSITLGTGATVDGRLLAQTAVSIDSSVVVEPSP
jgi:hypothetical protein